MQPKFETISLEHDGPLTWIVLNRPEKANALSAQLLDEFSAALAWLTDNGGAVIAIRGAGRGFSAGFDLDQVGAVTNTPDPVADRDRLARNLDRFWALWDHPKPIIAAVHGYCLAGATQMAVYADITVVADSAYIGEPNLPIGGGYIAPTWAPLVGPKRAKELSFLAGNRIDGAMAVEWGFANHVVPEAELVTTVTAFAHRIAEIPAEILRIKKLSVNRAMESMGVRAAAASAPEMDSLLHTAPSVIEIRSRIAEKGMKSVSAQFNAGAFDWTRGGRQ